MNTASYGGFAIYGSYPPGHGLYPNAIVDAAHVGNIGESGGRNSGHGGAFQHGLLHLGKTSRGLSEHKHDLGDALIGGEAESDGGRGQRIVLAGGQVVRQSAVNFILSEEVQMIWKQ